MRLFVSLLFCLLLACRFAKPLPLDARNAQEQQDKTPKIYDVVNVDGSSNLNLRSPPLDRDNINIDVRAPKKSYSVVNVDGDATETPEPSTVILTSTVATTASAAPTTKIIVSTEEASVAQTVVYTVTVEASATSTSTPITGTGTGAAPSATQPSVIVVTTTVSPTDTTSYYDNGMWHTYYPVKTWPTDGP
ncbi:hypothetical protein IWZ01DRAFT_20496 [Phyllosticta capitalensis]